jgi:NAD(P)-dependent dehydrogenase (short-subunit alcohol dehydrogenase family)
MNGHGNVDTIITDNNMDNQSITGMSAIVTGAGRGIGRSIALALARHGAHVALAARTLSELEQVRLHVESFGGQAVCIPTDVSSEAEVVRLVAQAAQQWGRLDIVVNNAGIGAFGPLEQASAAQWDQVMAVNARSAFLMCRESIPHLRKQRPSYIINITSVVGVKGYLNQALYSASKHAVMGMSKALAKEVQKDGIRVHAICPGGVDTDMAGAARPDLDRSVLISPEDIADVVLFLVTRRGNAVIDEIDVRRESSTPWA